MAVFAGRVEVLATARDVLPLRDVENFQRDTPKGLDWMFHSTGSTTTLSLVAPPVSASFWAGSVEEGTHTDRPTDRLL